MENESEIKKRILKKLHQAMMGGEVMPLLKITIHGMDPNSAVREGEYEESNEMDEDDESERLDPGSAVREGELGEIIRRKKRERGEI